MVLRNNKIHEEKRKRKPIPKAIREQIWLRDFGKAFESKCKTSWCNNTINVWDFHAGHNIPDSKGGPINPDNLVPICSRCNQSMSDNYTFTDWNSLNSQPVPVVSSIWCC